MSEMLKRVAIAIAASRGSGSWKAYEIEALAAVAALRNPTREVKLAANKVPIKRSLLSEDETYYVTGYEAEDIWHAMIDGIIDEILK